MNYIGIRGHRGAGKNTVAYLLGNCINYILSDKFNDEKFNELFQIWCDDIVTNEKIIHSASLDKVYFESFGDTLKMIIQLILGCPQEFLYSDYHKDHVVINLRDFSYKDYEVIPEDINIYSSGDLFKMMSLSKQPITITKNTYVTLREFIMYFGREVMQRYFGLNVWVKSLNSSQEFFTNIFNEPDEYKIYTDLKTPAEVTYIKNKEGVIVKVSRPSNKKPSKGIDKLSQDNRFDYEVIIDKDLYSIKDQILNISKEIISKNKHE